MVMATTSNPQFFRIILPGSLQELAIPRRFLKYLREGKCEKGEGVLRSSGKSWRVKIHGSYIKKGWADFARDCHLLIGDFLVFQHQGHMVFDVILFDRSACEKDYPSAVHAENEITREVQVRNRDFQSTLKTCAVSCKNPFFVATMAKSNLKKRALCIPKKFAESNGLMGKSGFVAILRDEGLRSWPVTLRQYTDGRVYFGGGWHDFALANRLKKQQLCIFRLISCGDNTIHKGDGNMVFDVSVVDSKPFSATSSKDFSLAYSHASHLQSHKSEKKVAQNRTFTEEERQNDQRTTLEDFRQSRKPHFFKPFLPDSYQQLKIPEEFLKHMTSENCKDGEDEVILKNPRCKSKSWPVKLKEFCFKEGWSSFVKDHELCLGEFVVFRHEGGLVFDVIVFGHSTCEKETYPALHMNIEDDKSVVEKKIKGPVSFVLLSVRGIGCSTTRYNRSREAKTSSSRQTSFDALGKQFVIRRPHTKQPMIPSHFLRSNTISRSMYKVIIRDQKGRCWPVKVTGNSNYKRLGGGWLEFISANCLKEEDICVFKPSSSGKIRNGGTIVVDFSISNSNYRGATVAKNDKIESTNPSFEKILMPFNFTQHRLYVPRCFARLNGMIGKTCNTTLRDGRGMQWRAELRYNGCDGHVCISSDWTQICASNGLKIGDTCTLELTRKGKQKAMEFSLH